MAVGQARKPPRLAVLSRLTQVGPADPEGSLSSAVAIQVAVVDPLPMFQQGVAAILSAAGHRVELPEDVPAWLGGGQPAVVLLTLASATDWTLLASLTTARSSCLVIALVEHEMAVLGVRAVRAGARSVLDRRMDTETLRRTVAATIDGQAVMPAAVAAALALRAPGTVGAPPDISPEQVSWLRELAAGTTVARLAERVGYSERAMFRLLRSLYRDMGVRTRTEALLRAWERGWLSRSERG
jgi:DNA-binding NarL/FixJ family response regulator